MALDAKFLNSLDLPKEAAEPGQPGEIPGFGQDINPVKDLAHRLGVGYDDGYPDVDDITASPIVIDFADKLSDGRDVCMEAIKIVISELEGDHVCNIPVSTAVALIEELRKAIRGAQKIKNGIHADATVAHESEL